MFQECKDGSIKKGEQHNSFHYHMKEEKKSIILPIVFKKRIKLNLKLTAFIINNAKKNSDRGNYHNTIKPLIKKFDSKPQSKL